MAPTFEYLPLPFKDCIRLLEFEAELGDDDDEVRCSVATWNKKQWAGGHTGSCAYAAISYSWEPSHPTKTIYLKSKPMEVGHNCWTALRTARWHQLATRYWIDSICINQDDADEKGSQVRMMSDIYATAQCTLAYVGDDSKIHDSLRRIANAVPPNHLSASIHPSYTAIELGRHWEAFSFLADRRYFHRLWIVQELLLAPTIWLLSGTARSDWRTLRDNWWAFQPASEAREQPSTLEHLLLRWTACRSAPYLDYGFAGLLCNYLSGFRDSECTLAQDRLYSLIPLALRQISPDKLRPSLGYPIDYGKSLLGVLVDLVDNLGPCTVQQNTISALDQLIDSFASQLVLRGMGRFLTTRRRGGVSEVDDVKGDLSCWLRTKEGTSGSSEEILAVIGLGDEDVDELPQVNMPGLCCTLSLLDGIASPSRSDDLVLAVVRPPMSLVLLCRSRGERPLPSPDDHQSDLEIIGHASLLETTQFPARVQDTVFNVTHKRQVSSATLLVHPRDLLAWALWANKRASTDLQLVATLPFTRSVLRKRLSKTRVAQRSSALMSAYTARASQSTRYSSEYSH